MIRLDERWLTPARLAGGALVAIGLVDLVVREMDHLSRREAGGALLATRVLLMAVHALLPARRAASDRTRCTPPCWLSRSYRWAPL